MLRFYLNRKLPELLSFTLSFLFHLVLIVAFLLFTHSIDELTRFSVTSIRTVLTDFILLMSEEEGQRSARILSDLEAQDIQHLLEISGGLEYADALQLMDENDWNLERAVHKLMGFEDASTRLRSNVSTDTGVPQVELVPLNQRVLRASDVPAGWIWSAIWFLLEPVRAGCHLVLSIFRYFTSLLWPDPRTQVTDAVGDVRRFIEYFKSRYARSDQISNNLDVTNEENSHIMESDMSAATMTVDCIPPFYEGSYSDAVQEAKRSLRFLIVYLHGDSHEDTHKFCKTTLQNPEVLNFLRNSNEILFWGCNIESPEGYRVSRTFREHAYPFIGLIGLANIVSEDGNFLGTTTRMALLGRIEGALEPNELVNQLKSIISEHEATTLAARVERNEREVTAQLRREQDLAYAASLAEDRAKAAARELERRNADLEAAQIARETERKEALEKARLKRQLKWRHRLPPQPESKDGSTVQLSVKFPQGVRFSRIFSIYDSIKILYYFVLAQEGAPSEFEIQSNFPKRVLPCQPPDESDLEDYINLSEDDLILSMKSEHVDIVSDSWHPKRSDDPPSFEQMGLVKPELLFVLNKNA